MDIRCDGVDIRSTSDRPLVDLVRILMAHIAVQGMSCVEQKLLISDLGTPVALVLVERMNLKQDAQAAEEKDFVRLRWEVEMNMKRVLEEGRVEQVAVVRRITGDAAAARRRKLARRMDSAWEHCLELHESKEEIVGEVSSSGWLMVHPSCDPTFVETLEER